MAEQKTVEHGTKIVPLYDKEGKQHLFHYIDAKEILAQKEDCQYFRQPPEVKVEKKDEARQEAELQVTNYKKKKDS